MFWVFVSWQPAASSVSVGALGCTNLNILNLNLVFSIWSCRYPQSSGNMWAARCGYVAKLMDPKKLVSAMETTPGTRRGYAWCVGRRAWTCAVAVRLVTRCDEQDPLTVSSIITHITRPSNIFKPCLYILQTQKIDQRPQTRCFL